MKFDIGSSRNDGDFGPSTENAIKQFQEHYAPQFIFHSDYRMEVSGVVDTGTLLGIDEALVEGFVYSNEPITIELTRKWQTSESTIGEYKVAGTEITGYILEEKGPDTLLSGQERRIPIGIYQLEWHYGSRFKGVLKLSNSDVPSSRAILIHKGNTAADTEGCLLPGKIKAQNFVGQSAIAFDEVITAVKGRGINGARIIIREAYEN